jgi:hypothetical protein
MIRRLRTSTLFVGATEGEDVGKLASKLRALLPKFGTVLANLGLIFAVIVAR